ncbi:type IV toxin-antitoxin system AbiEi family antitoxin domain-containing protein [uncultured Arthrobacter sp.]|uniref:type IV toxin-antitoxin system AbiEi family antitoxin domain-containing protein n=1 Tax=uncultured Arthrobacter sp. TaxID=114050 RepID=UPI0028D80CB6|nr:type IV toxin-antitoxin system AbiEi family antitoxin domain-containing protein [uncultured Arthrobacter sp.]
MQPGGATLDGMQPTEFLSRHGGAARLAHLRRAGFSRSQISQAVNSGLLLNARHGVYQLPQANCDFVRAYEANAAITCVSAASHYSLWMLKAPAEPHLAACHRRLLPGARSGRARAVLDLVERGSDSLLETVARVLFRRHGFDVRTQVYLAGIGYVDFQLNGCLIVEIDGVGFHLNKPQFKKDIRRNNVGAATGYRVLRYLYEDVLHMPDDRLEQIRLALATPPRTAR